MTVGPPERKVKPNAKNRMNLRASAHPRSALADWAMSQGLAPGNAGEGGFCECPAPVALPGVLTVIPDSQVFNVTEVTGG